MEAVVGLLLMILGVTHGGETYCDGRHSGAQCYGALGGTVVIRLMDDTSEIFGCDWRKGPSVILRWRNKMIQGNYIKDRSLFNPSDGTFRINDLSRNDSGQYNLKIYDSKGSVSPEQTLQLFIEAPVSSVHLVSECLSHGEKRLSCSSDGGDSPQYSWTLDGHSVTDAELLSGNNETNIITLKQDVSGHLVCSVRNHVSSVSRDEMISTCGFIFINCTSNGTHISEWVFEATNTLCIKPTTVPTSVPDTCLGHVSLVLPALKAAVIMLLFIATPVYFAWKKKKEGKDEDSAVPQTPDSLEDSVMMVEMRS